MAFTPLTKVDLDPVSCHCYCKAHALDATSPFNRLITYLSELSPSERDTVCSELLTKLPLPSSTVDLNNNVAGGENFVGIPAKSSKKAVARQLELEFAKLLVEEDESRGHESVPVVKPLITATPERTEAESKNSCSGPLPRVLEVHPKASPLPKPGKLCDTFPAALAVIERHLIRHFPPPPQPATSPSRDDMPVSSFFIAPPPRKPGRSVASLNIPPFPEKLHKVPKLENLADNLVVDELVLNSVKLATDKGQVDPSPAVPLEPTSSCLPNQTALPFDLPTSNVKLNKLDVLLSKVYKSRHSVFSPDINIQSDSAQTSVLLTGFKRRLQTAMVKDSTLVEPPKVPFGFLPSNRF